jgi:phosphohistidine phosphatase
LKRLIIVRHAKADKKDQRLKDFDRPLTARGEKDAAEMGRRLARRGLHPDTVVSSPALRALATAKLIARELDFPWAEIRLETEAYEADAGALVSIVRSLDDRAEIAMIVGHNPGVTALAQTLVRTFTADLPTSAVVVLDLAVDAWAGVRSGSGRLSLFDAPKAEL